MKAKKNIITIDASSTVSGGGLTYLVEFLNASNADYQFNIICSTIVSKKIPVKKNIKIFSHNYLSKGILYRIIFQLFMIDRFIDPLSIILISLSGDYLGKFKPYIGVCQNMLLYERDKQIGMRFLEKIKFEILRIRQILSFNNSNGVIFLSEYAKKKVSPLLKIKNLSVINFGISNRFFYNLRDKTDFKDQFKLLYISSIHTYKNQLNLLLALEEVIKVNSNFSLTLIGPIIDNHYWKKVKRKIDKINDYKKIVNYINFIDFELIHEYYNKHNIFIFPSKCENMPNILFEAMASGLPILSSKNDPMPEFLKKNAIYFDPDDIHSIVKKILYSSKKIELLKTFAINNISSAKKYNWQDNYNKTIIFINKTILNV